MRAMPNSSGSWPGIKSLLAVTTALLALAACDRIKQKTASAPPQVQLTPAAAARAKLVAEIVVPSVERTLGNVEAVAKRLGLPFSAADLKTMLMARSKVGASALDRIDFSKPVVVAVFLATKKGATAESAEAALTFEPKPGFSGPGGLQKLVAGLGQVTETSGDAVRFRPGDAGAGGGGAGNSAWLVERGGVVCGSDSLEELVAGCGLAMEARKSAASDVRVALIPEAIARANGTTLKDALAKARQELAAQQAKAQTLPGADPKMQANAAKLAESMVGWMFDAVADTGEAHIALSLDAGKGLSTDFEVVPKPGTGLARTVAARHPYEIHPALAGGAPGALWTMGDTTLSRTIFNSMRGPLLELVTPEAERAKASATIDALFDALSGPFSARFGFEQGSKLSLAYDVVYTMKPGTDGKKVLADLESTMKAPWLAHIFDVAFQGMMKVKLTAKREGETLAMAVVADTKKLPKEMKSELKWLPLFDGAPLEARTTVAGDKLVMSLGSGTKARLAALLAGGAAAPPSGDLAAALAESKGADALYYTDLAAMLKPFFALAATGAVGTKGSPDNMKATMMGRQVGTMLANAHLAMWGSYRGGTTATVSGRIPMSTMESIGLLARGAMGAP